MTADQCNGYAARWDRIDRISTNGMAAVPTVKTTNNPKGEMK